MEQEPAGMWAQVGLALAGTGTQPPAEEPGRV